VAAPAELEEIVRDELRQPIEQLVRQVVVELVREQLNGAAPGLGPPTETAVDGPENAQQARNGPSRISDTPQTSSVLKTCRVCGEQKPARAFERGHRQCRQCRRAAERRSRERRTAARATAKADRELHPDAKAPSVDRWLVDRGLAEKRDGELVATDAGRELGGAIFD
jgi:hypothetical protein